ncbi:hypothetical protein HYH02_010988 [Chlamydomonas schloesseri]|uniref:S1 motif domain-containing protein n=1 Tax=Chlamydomonas schloesseri TaxID=2026947 RepID=A0A835TIE7_9CHLO|nr:hypothetical protein HYH02_010988 [Chlamydomonas schloesseri]|eukprot:KAG2438290.1 hypothetical protein HYH02_010988 [Chlamydomonas schloesseri]
MSDNEELEDQLPPQQEANEDGEEEAQGEGEAGEGAAGLVEGEADEEDEAEYQDSSEEDEDEEQNEYEQDGFIVDDAEEEEEEEEERVAPKRKKKKKRERELRLDDDDYDLLEENQVQGIRRPTGRKRLKSQAEDARRATNEADLQKDLFGYEELEDEVEDAGGRDARRDEQVPLGEEDFDDLDDQDEMADFIVEGDESAPRRRQRRRAAAIPGVSSRAMQDAFEIFGDVDALMEMYETARQRPAAGAAAAAAGEEEDAGEGEEDDFGDDDDEAAAEARRQKRQERQRAKTYRQAMKVMDPEQLARAHLRPEDQAIKDRDVPERLQELLGSDGGAAPGAGMDLDAAAEWVYTNMREANTPEWRLLARGAEEIDGTYDGVVMSGRQDDPDAGKYVGQVEGEDVVGGPEGCTLRLSHHRALLTPRMESGQRSWTEDAARHGRVKAAIRAVLGQFFERHEEVPVVAMYRKELAGPLLALAPDDAPAVTSRDEYDRQRSQRHKKHYDQGFVQPHHRRIRRWAVLWAVFDTALRYRAMAQRRERAAAALGRSRELLAEALAAAPDQAGDKAAQLEYDLRALDECGEALQTANTLEGLADVQQRMNVVLAAYPEAQIAMLSISSSQGGGGGGTQGGGGGGGAVGATRRPNRGAANRTARLIGMQELVADFCMEPSAFLANLQEAGHAGVGAHEPRTPPGSIHDWAVGALESLKARHPDNPIISSYSPESLTAAVRAAAVSNLVGDAGLRTFLRNEFFKQAVVSCEATEAGEAVLDPFHKYALAARLRKKKLADFGASDLYLRLDEAARERLATLRLHLESSAAEKLVNDVAELFQSSDRGALAQAWNTLRRDVVKSALEEQLLPAFKAHFSAKLLAEAKEHALRLYSEALWKVASAGPLRLPLADSEDEFLASPRLCIVCYGNQELNPATGQPNNTAVVFLNELGNLTDFFFAGQLSGQIRRSGQGAGAVFTDPAKSKDAARIREKLLEHLPHAVLVGISAPACRQLHEDMRNIVDSLLEHHADALIDHETRGITVFPMDEKLSALWEVSAAGRSELREHAPLVRRAVGLGRSALDPLNLLAALCGPDKEVLSLGVYDMQDALGKDERMAAVARVMVTAGAQVGVDVNLACNVPWRSELLQFVPGLGPRKAGALLAALTRNRNKAESRSMLYKDLGVLGKVVFRNCGAYLRVRQVPGIRHLENLSFRTLDNTRISPEHYRIAIQLAQAATGVGEAEAALEEREKIESFDLEKFMSDAAAEGKPLPVGLPTLIDIVAELVCPAMELRPPWQEISPRQVFLLCNNESEESLQEGRVVDVKITYVTRDCLKVILINSGTEGLVPADQVSGSYTGRAGGPEWQSAMQARLNSVARGRILRIEEQPDQSGSGTKYVVVLSTKSAVVNDENGEYERKYCASREPNYHVREKAEATAGKRRVEDAGRSREQAVLVRPIRHPMFKNISQLDAVTALGPKEVPVGSAIIRPSYRRNPNELDVTIKIAQLAAGPVFAVAFLREADKPQGRAAHLTLAPPFTVDAGHCGLGNLVYEDLDQVIADYVEPLVSHCQQLTSHRKFLDATPPEVEERVRGEKRANPAVHPYYLALREKNAQAQIVFCYSSSVHRESFYVTPRGYYFRGRLHGSVDGMLAVFKKSPVDPNKRREAAAREQLGYSAPTGALPQMRTGVQPQQQPGGYTGGSGGMGGGGGSGYGAPGGYGGGSGGYGAPGGGFPPTQVYGSGGPGMYGGPGGGGGGGGYGGMPPPPPPFGGPPGPGGGGGFGQPFGSQGGGGGGYRPW